MGGGGGARVSRRDNGQPDDIVAATERQFSGRYIEIGGLVKHGFRSAPRP